MKVLILGGYGNFGKRVARLLTRKGIAVLIAGRDGAKAAALAKVLPPRLADWAIFDAESDLPRQLEILKPLVVINTCGPFQNADYGIARACIASGVHYIDLADGRDFVTGITQLDADAKEHNVAVISGASTVPALSAAVIEHFLPQFSAIDSLTFGIAPGQKAERGLATTQAILSYVGKKLKPCAGYETRYGWQNIYLQPYPEIGSRWMANCDIPDLDLLPEKYGIKRIRFSAGMEIPVIHFGLWLLSWGVRLGLPIDLSKHASVLLNASNWLDPIDSADGGMHVILKGADRSGRPITRQWFIIARDGDGPYIPTVPAVVLAAKIVSGTYVRTGAMPCVGMMTLQEYLDELGHLKIKTYAF
ncbi:MAG: saccharopine dehydrogenase NADP-binding domain-containing protein [Xanthobacteraceae bacterium]